MATSITNQKGALKDRHHRLDSGLNYPVIKDEPKRYCLFVSKACPWAHRLDFLKLKGQHGRYMR